MPEIPIEPHAGGVASRTFHVKEDDLADLERYLPDLAEGVMMSRHYSNKDKVMLRRVQQIIMNIRWNYGPYGEVEVLDA